MLDRDSTSYTHPTLKSHVKVLLVCPMPDRLISHLCIQSPPNLHSSDSMHLPIKKDHLKKMHIPKQPQDEELDSILKEVRSFLPQSPMPCSLLLAVSLF